MEETVRKIDTAIQNNTQLHHTVVNAAKIVNMQKDNELYNSVIQADIVNPDGQAIVWASWFLNQPLLERVTGIDIMQNLVKLASEKKYKIFFFGAKNEVVKKVVDKYSKQYSKDIIAGYRNGYFNKDKEETIAKQIANSKADILFVAISSPTKEIFLNRFKHIVKVPFIMGVGGSFDVVAGKVKRAPLWMQKYGLEWFYRFLQEPRRMWKRAFLTNGEFIYLVLKEKFINMVNIL
jgi:N-acetylglucosaminyldiphosphoundecaprenol N-acetyl-beta-D-mannosaminyltransferase